MLRMALYIYYYTHTIQLIGEIKLRYEHREKVRK